MGGRNLIKQSRFLSISVFGPNSDPLAAGLGPLKKIAGDNECGVCDPHAAWQEKSERKGGNAASHPCNGKIAVTQVKDLHLKQVARNDRCSVS